LQLYTQKNRAPKMCVLQKKLEPFLWHSHTFAHLNRNFIVIKIKSLKSSNHMLLQPFEKEPARTFRKKNTRRETSDLQGFKNDA